MKNLKNIFVVLTISILLTSCIFSQKKQKSICNIIVEPSYLCELAETNNITLEDVGAVIIVSNSIAIAEGAYSVQDSIKVFKNLRNILENPVSYLFFRSQINKSLIKYPGLFIVADSYLDELKSPKIMYSLDRAMLRSWIDKKVRGLEESL